MDTIIDYGAHEAEQHTIHRAEPYQSQLDEYIWAIQERWAIAGFAAGGIASTIFWLLVLGW